MLRMSTDSEKIYQAMLGKQELPQSVRVIHDRFVRFYHAAFTREPAPAILALILALCEETDKQSEFESPPPPVSMVSENKKGKSKKQPVSV